MRSAAVGVSGALSLVLVACGGAGNASTAGTAGASSRSARTLRPARDGSGEDLADGKRGGILTVLNHPDYAHLDPGQAYTTADYQVIYATQSPLDFFPPNSSTHSVPLLAASPPVISDGGRTVTVRIRHGVRFSPPVNREVTSADVAYAIERGANPNVSNPYFRAYFHDIEGAAKANGGPISGISLPDRYTIVFHLTGPYGTFFVGALSLPLSAPVPKEFAAPLDAKKPTEYGSVYEVATGPYMLKADKTGRFLNIGYVPGRSVTLVRNPNWTAATGDPRPAYLDGMNVSIGGDPNVIGRQVLIGTHMVENDGLVAPAILELAYRQYYNQLVLVPGAGVSYIALNNKQGPFANPDVRKALWAALDRRGMVKISGAGFGQLGTHFIYPGTLGYSQAGGDHGPRVDYNEYPAGSMAVAAKYMKLAGYRTGRYTGSHTVTVVGATGPIPSEIATIVDTTLERLGFTTNLSVVDYSVVYSKLCGTPAEEIDVCAAVGWVRDWSDPQTILDPTFAGYNIVPSGNSNYGQVSWQDGPAGAYPGQATTTLDKAMQAAEATVGTQARAAAWAKIDRMLTADAVAIPWTFSRGEAIESADVRGINDLWNQGFWDYNYTSLR
jgi:peptide/nickel transport system substrate-binding protein